MNSATGLEFAYTQAPPSMKSVVQSFWLLTTCVGNIIDIFLIEIKLWKNQVSFKGSFPLNKCELQTGEYFILALIMACSSTIFTLLSIFYYDYVPEDAFEEEEAALKGTGADAESVKSSDKAKEAEAGEVNDGYESEDL